MVRTLGFGRPHQGVLVYDTIGGQELGVLVRGRADWTPVRLYRQAVDDGEVSVMFELIGAGEASVDDVQLRVWDPQRPRVLPLRPIVQRTIDPEFLNGPESIASPGPQSIASPGPQSTAAPGPQSTAGVQGESTRR
jgi:hypothetical protein